MHGSFRKLILVPFSETQYNSLEAPFLSKLPAQIEMLTEESKLLTLQDILILKDEKQNKFIMLLRLGNCWDKKKFGSEDCKIV